MSRRLWAALTVAAVAAGGLLGYLVLVATTGTQSPQAAGQSLYLANCASCHGARLEGQPDWTTRRADGRLPAPPHDETGHTWHHSDRELITIVRSGLGAIVPGYESDMPAFQMVLSDDEITSILDYIKSTWPEQARAYQAERSKADP